MSMAMHASKLAFENITDYLKKKINRSQMENMYEKQWQQAFSKRLFIGRTVQRLFGRNDTTAFFLKTMQRFPSLATKVIQSTHGVSFN